MIDNIESFINEVVEYKTSSSVFNPWRQYDPYYDIGEDAPQIRRRNLTQYLYQRVPNAEYLLIAEALGYQGGRFSGIAMTSERMMIDKNKQIPSNVIIKSDRKKERTSNPNSDLKKDSRKIRGFAEPTATIVWDCIIKNKLDPNKVILWNIFPFHPFDSNEGQLSNRTPTEKELHNGLYFVKKLIALNPAANIITIGEHSHNILTRNAIPNHHIAHPANGGASDFRSQFKSFLEKVEVSKKGENV